MSEQREGKIDGKGSKKGKERHGWGKPFKKPRWAGFTTGWVKGWSSDEAVRELLQNMFDQAAASPPSTGFTLSNEVRYPSIKGARRMDVLAKLDRSVRGHIVWCPVDGMLFLINRQATLPASALQVGSSSKDWRSAPNGRCAGKHGEGLKAAVATLLRQGLSIEIHQAGGGLVFSVADDTVVDAPPQPIKYMFTDGYTSHRQLDVKDELARMRRLDDLNVSRAKDVIVVVEGLKDFPAAFKRYFLVRSHVEQSVAAPMTNPNHFVRLPTPYGDLLWPSDPKHEDGVQGRVYVVGIFWADTQGPPLYGVDFPSDVSDDRDRRLINNHAYCKRMAKVFDALLQSTDAAVVQFRSKLVQSLLRELESKDGVNSNKKLHLFHLARELSEPAIAQLADAFRRNKIAERDKTNVEASERPIANFLMPTSGPIQEGLKKWASGSCFDRSSEQLYAILIKHGHFSSEQQIAALSKQNLELCRVSTDWPPQLLSVLMNMWPNLVADRLELRDTGDERCVPNCVWMPSLGKIVISSSRILDASVWKVVKAIKDELKVMGQTLAIDTTAARHSQLRQTASASVPPATTSAVHSGGNAVSSSQSPHLARKEGAPAASNPPVAKSPHEQSDAPPAPVKPQALVASPAAAIKSDPAAPADPQAHVKAAAASVSDPPAPPGPQAQAAATTAAIKSVPSASADHQAHVKAAAASVSAPPGPQALVAGAIASVTAQPVVSLPLTDPEVAVVCNLPDAMSTQAASAEALERASSSESEDAYGSESAEFSESEDTDEPESDVIVIDPQDHQSGSDDSDAATAATSAPTSMDDKPDAASILNECQRRRLEADWTQSLLANDLESLVKPEADDDDGELLVQRLSQRFNFNGADIPCSIPSLIELCTSDLQSFPIIERLSNEIVSCLGFGSSPTCCWLDAEVEAFVVGGGTININLRPILLGSRTYTERELFVYLAAVLCHEIAHVQLPAEGHSARHGQLRNDLMSRLLLKTDRLLATRPALESTAAASSGQGIKRTREPSTDAANGPWSRRAEERMKKRRRTTWSMAQRYLQSSSSSSSLSPPGAPVPTPHKPKRASTGSVSQAPAVVKSEPISVKGKEKA